MEEFDKIPDTTPFVSPIQTSPAPENTVTPTAPPSSQTGNTSLLKVIFFLFIVALVVLTGYLGYQNYQLKNEVVERQRSTNKVDPDQVICTLDAIICPDGTSVGRVSPNCEFAECPATINTSDWETHESARFQYSFKYPKDWELLAYDEESEDVKFGTNTLHSYSTTEIENFMDHGKVDWRSFLGDKPAIKIDFAVYSEKLNEIGDNEGYLTRSVIEKATQLPTSDLNINGLKTIHYKATEDLGPTDVAEINQFFAFPDEERLIYINLYFWNIDSYESLKKTEEWKSLTQILSTFEFIE